MKTQSPSRHRVDLSLEDFALLEQAAAIFGMNRSDVVRRLLRGALEVAPALTAESSQKLTELSHQLRMVGRNLAQLLRAVHDGRMVGMEETEAVWEGLHQRLKEIDAEVMRMTRAHGLRLRRAGQLQEKTTS